jgi:hypothetical protein
MQKLSEKFGQDMKPMQEFVEEVVSNTVQEAEA